MKKIAILIGLLIVTLITLFIVVQLNQNPEVTKTPENTKQEIVTISGEYSGTKGGMIVVDGVLLGIREVEEKEKYYGKIVEVKGVLVKTTCYGSDQCFNGPEMINIQSIKVIFDNTQNTNDNTIFDCQWLSFK